jgi:hypothetical protein
VLVDDEGRDAARRQFARNRASDDAGSDDDYGRVHVRERTLTRTA